MFIIKDDDIDACLYFDLIAISVCYGLATIGAGKTLGQLQGREG